MASENTAPEPDRTHVARQILVFRDHPNFPKEKLQFDGLVDAFLKACSTERMFNGVLGHLTRTLKFAPLPADIYAAAEQIAQRAATANAPSFRDEPGSENINLVDEMPAEQLERYKALLRNEAADPYKRAFAHTVLKTYRDRNPESPAIDEELRSLTDHPPGPAIRIPGTRKSLSRFSFAAGKRSA